MEVDQTAFKYDEVWDDMKEAEKRARKSKEEAEEGRAVSPYRRTGSGRTGVKGRKGVLLSSTLPSFLSFFDVFER